MTVEFNLSKPSPKLPPELRLMQRAQAEETTKRVLSATGVLAADSSILPAPKFKGFKAELSSSNKKFTFARRSPRTSLSLLSDSLPAQAASSSRSSLLSVSTPASSKAFPECNSNCEDCQKSDCAHRKKPSSILPE